MIFEGKKGQVTTFVIIGIVIVLLVIGFLLTRDRFTDFLEPKEIEVPVQAQGVKNHIGNCISDLLEEAILKIGAQGGYITMPGDPISVGKFTNTLQLYGNSKVIFWNYIADNNVEYIQRPTLDIMEDEIADYIDQNLMNCLGTNFVTFDDFTVTIGRIETKADIQKKRTVVKITFPMEVKKEDFEFRFNEFYSVNTLPLWDTFFTANNIFSTEEDELFLEQKTLDMLSFYEEIPYVGETSDCVSPIWVKERVIQDFKKIARENIQTLKVKGTNYTLIREKDKYFEIDAGVDDEQITTSFMFSQYWPLEMQIYPEKDGLLKGASVTEPLGELRGVAEAFFCISTYEFLYNIKYPVLILVNKDDYTFQFATMVMIDRNEPRHNTQEFSAFTPYDQRFCNEQTSFDVDTVDQNFNNLNGVNVQYKCINHLCDLGISSGGSWRGKAPLCINGVFIGNKQGYHTAKTEKSTNEEGYALLVLEKLRPVKVEVLIERAGSGEIKPGEKVYITLKEELKEFHRFILYPNQKTVELIPGYYTAQINLISPGRITIPEKTFTNCVEVPKGPIGGVFGLTEEECTEATIPETTVDQIVTGTEKFDFTISEDNFQYNTIRFYAPYHGVIRDITELTNLTTQRGRPPIFL